MMFVNHSFRYVGYSVGYGFWFNCNGLQYYRFNTDITVL